MSKKVYDYTIAEIKDKVSKYSLKCTPQRIAIYNALLSSNHPAAEEVFATISNKYPSISLSTVYTTLEKFSEQGLIVKINTKNGRMRYDVRIEPHAHLYCKQTEKVIDYFDEELLDKVSGHLKKKKLKNFEYTDFQILINGHTTH